MIKIKKTIKIFNNNQNNNKILKREVENAEYTSEANVVG